MVFFHTFFVNVEGLRAKNIFCKSAKKKFAWTKFVVADKVFAGDRL